MKRGCPDMERTKIISAIDTVNDIQLLHSRSEQIAMVLGNKYFYEEPMDSTGKMLARYGIFHTRK